jgi:chloramphenicol-sensitive protein RarD
MNEPPAAASPRGLLYGLAAYVFWGVVPIYFNALREVRPLELLAHRILWSVPLLALLLMLGGTWSEFRRCFRSYRLRLLFLGSTVCIAVNWFVYIYGVVTKQVVQTSLGYFICPLVSVLLGRLILGERLRRLQWIAVFLAAVGVGLLIFQGGEWPWIALSLAFSFALYGLLRKLAAVDGLAGLSVETCLLAPLAAGYLLWLQNDGTLQWGQLGLTVQILLLLSGIVTAVPLLCFGQAAKLLPLSTLGFLQYVSPSLQLIVAVYVLEQPFHFDQFLCYCVIWVGLLIFSVDSYRLYRQRAEMLERWQEHQRERKGKEMAMVESEKR